MDRRARDDLGEHRVRQEAGVASWAAGFEPEQSFAFTANSLTLAPRLYPPLDCWCRPTLFSKTSRGAMGSFRIRSAVPSFVGKDDRDAQSPACSSSSIPATRLRDRQPTIFTRVEI